ncbi:MAG: hypothetical protein AUJ32_02565 [Parcubacteria group bacterium CG1_02_40_82]|uniref:ASCH domain-containing protein n=2 Tax=Candidatus Portnoyibacteriota TaxID=1817913 RepID=A0A2H0KSF6_9BACT|nr:MAG: hypothetical protein AUJ32_02565 [Parcubacteria group bacterium CG1_02_40_82]PIQ75082.1 MAG: hypothetical protein COV84_03255 [Candidatus Portnoybacteria bacterium CG11_big_fil_rev_8_21_14_0_20_40_15]PIS30557.1 MAG: hypothetical protein COT41_03275 [Candidatus Portnoybacteria bacterium CG08_land_8_20_14_0_20_40_83]PIY75381.1 MAG: hypothetical protein COY85_00390 [Candidatus Portnoybacteria bacterium CG_4_10_14_0_8_um_filter_40_50]
MGKNTTLKFRAVNRDIFEAIKNGSKKIETRAATKKFKNIRAGDRIVLVCGKQRFENVVKAVRHFKTIKAMLKKYKIRQVNPWVSTEQELRQVYWNFPNYKEKIKKYGIIAFELK